MPQPEIAGLRRKFHRLGTMRPREIAHRIREKGYTELERFGLVRNDPELRAGPQFKRYLTNTAAGRFYAGPRENLRELFAERFPAWVERAGEEAERLLRPGGEVDWHRDPVTGQIWERLFWTAYNPELNHAGRDVKNVHELNRHQHLPRLAKAWSLTGDERYAAEAVAQMLGWIEQNPPDMGINWQSSLEIAIRAISWMWTIFLLLPSESFGDAAAVTVGDSLFLQLEHVFHHTSEFSSPNTHLIGEAAALFIGGLVFNDRKRPAAWLEKGASLLEAEIEKQILSDGVDAELSSYYHCYALDFFLQVLILAEQNQYPLESIVREKAEGMAGFVTHLARPDGSLPLLGDDDGGRALALHERNYHATAGLLSVAAGYFRRDDFKRTEEALWFLGREAFEKKATPQRTEAFYPAAGYAIQRSGWNDDASHLIFDCGGLGMLTGGHSHADSLSILLSKGGRELLADPGTFVYNCAPEWRNYFRSTRAHNTVVVDERDQAERAGTFAWKNTIPARGRHCDGYFEGEHDGYASLGVTHRRRVIRIGPEDWVIADDFRGSGSHTFDFHYHFGPDVHITTFNQEDGGTRLDDVRAGFALALYASHSLRTELLFGETAPIEGWTSRGYGDKEPSITLRASAAGEVPATALTFLSTGTDRPSIRRLFVNAPGAVACVSRCATHKDIFVASAGGFCWTRVRDGIVGKAFSIGTAINLLEDAAVCAQFAES
ncbi:MAG TPA: alginate lyase family protein [Bryobacteraceae bacterium]|jgi:hypothetical protein|nr:alginate lyase family protein [Bryobacteraceae bacterium]